MNECFNSEIDKYANSVYRKHYPNIKELGDVKTIKSDRIKRKIDLITFGFPCQDLSIAGKGKGLHASRSGLFFKAMQIIRAKKPKYIIFENVKGLLSSNEGRDWITVLRTIARAGYDGQWQILNTRWFLPQNRERIFFVGHVRGKSRPEVFPIGESSEKFIKESEEEAICRTIRTGGRNSLTKKHNWELITMGDTSKNSQGNRVYSSKGCSVALNSQSGEKGTNTGLYQIAERRTDGGDKIIISVKEATKLGYTEATEGDSVDLTAESKTRRGRVGKGVAQTLGTGCQQGVVNSGIRRLTPMECERLQGFPDNWTKHGIDEKGKRVKISETQRYKMLGNAVSVPVVKAVILKLLQARVKINSHLDLFSGCGGFRKGIEEAKKEFIN